MDGWAAALKDLFGPELSGLMGLDRVSTGQDFEELLGELTRWLQLGDLNRRFSPMTSGTDDGRDGIVTGFVQGLVNAEARGHTLEAGLDHTLFEHFGPERFDAQGAASAYRELFEAIDFGKKDQLICATTNYDRSLELALKKLDYRARTGFRFDGIDTTVTLSAQGLGEFGRTPSMLYLHGAVGWYRGGDGRIVAYPAREPYRAELGRPAVLYPSYNKIVEDTVVRDIWVEFDRAIENATHIVVLGHGLQDGHLVDRLRRAFAPICVTAHTDDDVHKIKTMLPQADWMRMDFGPSPQFDWSQLGHWVSTAGLDGQNVRPIRSH